MLGVNIITVAEDEDLKILIRIIVEEDFQNFSCKKY